MKKGGVFLEVYNSTWKGGGEEIPLVQDKEQWLRFAGAAVKRYPTPKIRETQVDGRCCKRASEGKHTETILTEN